MGAYCYQNFKKLLRWFSSPTMAEYQCLEKWKYNKQVMSLSLPLQDDRVRLEDLYGFSGYI